MFQGTGSDVGKSTLVAGLCRIALRRGLSVAPFKPQNMSNNAAACQDGGEIGRAQALQARACGLPVEVDFNPVLLKPQSDRHSQVVVHGKVLETMQAGEFMNDRRQHLMAAVASSFTRLSSRFDLILVEGAGSAAEVNLRSRDIANMGFARHFNAPVCLVGDIDRGGVIASLVGTRNVIDTEDAALIKSFIINRFRGDPALFTEGVSTIEKMTQWPCRGVVPWLDSAMRLPQEDAVVLERGVNLSTKTGVIVRSSVPMLSRIANFDDMDPLSMEPGVQLDFVPPGHPIPRDIDAVVIPGTKSAMGDLAFLRAQGWDHDIIAFARSGGRVTGLCGGYQLLGNHIHDPQGIDGEPGSAPALGLLDVETMMQAEKQTRQISGRCTRSQAKLKCYEIHVGTCIGPDTARPMTVMAGVNEGAINKQGNIEGTYLHGLFGNDEFRHWWLGSISAGYASNTNYEAQVDQELDKLADNLETVLDVDSLFADARQPDAMVNHRRTGN